MFSVIFNNYFILSVILLIFVQKGVQDFCTFVTYLGIIKVLILQAVNVLDNDCLLIKLLLRMLAISTSQRR